MAQALGTNYTLREHVGIARVPAHVAQEYLEAHNGELPKVIRPEIRVLTADKATQNFTFYPEASLCGNQKEGTGLISFIRPYPVPILRDHLMSPGAFYGLSSETYGRVVRPAEFRRTMSEGFIVAVPEITHPEAIEAIMTGRWLTTSLGSRTNLVNCSVCKQDLTQENDCPHEKGGVYHVEDNEVVCLWVIGPIRAKEISFVNNPSDDQAGVLSTDLKESFNPLSRCIVGNESGLWDLYTGKQVAEAAHGTRACGSPGFCFLGFSHLTESKSDSPENSMAKKDTPAQDKKTLPEAFKGAGRYLLLSTYWRDVHDHEITLDGNGDGTSSESGSDKHVHEVVGGVCRVAGNKDDEGGEGNGGHTHYLDVIHASAESTDEDLEKAREERVVTQGELYHLGEDDPDLAAKDEAALTAKQRDALPASAFCGPDRSFPAQDKSHVSQGLRMLSRYKGPGDKSKIEACLKAKGKKLGMTFGKEYAAQMIDKEHAVTLNLFPLPENAEEMNAVLPTVESMPFTDDEKNQILGNIRRVAKEFLSDEDLRATFGEIEEVVEALALEITSENYGLLYSAAQFAAPTREVPPVDESVEEPPATDTEEPPVTEQEPAVEEGATSQETPVDEATPSAEPPAAPKDTVVEQVDVVQPQNTELAEQYRSALVEMVALTKHLLRKPDTRGKGFDEIAKAISGRSLDSLRDTYTDLRQELLAGPPVDVASLGEFLGGGNAVLTDPTATEKAAEDGSEPPDGVPAQGITISQPTEWDEDEGETNSVFILHQLYPESLPSEGATS